MSPTGFEPATFRLRAGCSTTELQARCMCFVVLHAIFCIFYCTSSKIMRFISVLTTTFVLGYNAVFLKPTYLLTFLDFSSLVEVLKMTSSRKECTKVAPFNRDRIQREAYCLNDMLMDQFNHPQFYHDGDFTACDYTDRLFMADKKYQDIHDKHFKGTLSWEYNPPNPEKMLTFLNELYQEKLAKSPGIKITGYRLVRFTDARQYPIFRIDAFGKSPVTPLERTYTGNQGWHDETEHFEIVEPEHIGMCYIRRV